MKPILIFCAANNIALARIAIDAGFKYGVQLPGTVYFPPYFADQDWKSPDRVMYMALLREHRPMMATVLDWEREEQLSEILDWAEEVAQYVLQDIIIVPKVIGGIRCLPKRIGDKRVVLGYSVPTAYGGTYVPIWEFSGWPIHLLGGTPQKQIEMWYHLRGIAGVVSLDGSSHSKMATRHCQFWVNGTAHYASNRFWPTLKEVGDGVAWVGENAYQEAFRRSCVNIIKAWEEI